MSRHRSTGKSQTTGKSQRIRASRRPSKERSAHQQLPRMGHWRADGSAKVRFISEEDANKSAFRLRMEMHLDLEAYQCDICGYWHLGNSPD
ncbi:MAG: hypothetical protein M1456_07490 [Actinobacteria bacterium]|nr:hypothetical protein [Actinomycetota bacterium]